MVIFIIHSNSSPPALPVYPVILCEPPPYVSAQVKPYQSEPFIDDIQPLHNHNVLAPNMRRVKRFVFGFMNMKQCMGKPQPYK
jgi:hypothetical protein